MRGQLWWASVDGAARPWLIMQADVLNDTAPTLLALPVTLARQDAGWPLTVRLDPIDTGFPRPSWARTTLLRALQRGELEEPIATLRPARVDDIGAAIGAVLGLGSAQPRRDTNSAEARISPKGVESGHTPINEDEHHSLHP
jgi:mRNA-degrading endonuclease toxin of MazEF toxin-antitoxin module